MKYLITIDLDGTLLRDDKKISSNTIAVLTKLKEQGHKIVLATGRPIHGAIPYYKELDLNTPVITDNGSLISNPSDETFKDIRTTIPLDLFKSMYKSIKPYLGAATVNHNYKLYAYNYNEDFELTFNGFHANEVFEMDLMDLEFAPMNLPVFIPNKDKKPFESYFKNSSLDARYWGEHEGLSFYDIHLREVSKATAIKKILDYYNLSSDNLITIGDGPNDIEMLKLTDNGTAMLNGKDHIKSNASYITDYDNNNDGVAKHLAKFFKL